MRLKTLQAGNFSHNPIPTGKFKNPSAVLRPSGELPPGWLPATVLIGREGHPVDLFCAEMEGVRIVAVVLEEDFQGFNLFFFGPWPAGNDDFPGLSPFPNFRGEGVGDPGDGKPRR